MITLSVLLIIVIIAVILALVFGAGFIFVLGDMVIAFLIIKLCTKLFKKKKEN